MNPCQFFEFENFSSYFKKLIIVLYFGAEKVFYFVLLSILLCSIPHQNQVTLFSPLRHDNVVLIIWLRFLIIECPKLMIHLPDYLLNCFCYCSSLASYGAYVCPMPYSNELGLRMLIAGAVREASVLGYHVMPLFSYYSYHGPVFRVLLRLNRGKPPNNRWYLDVILLQIHNIRSNLDITVIYSVVYSRHYSFISYCIECGNSQAIMWDKLGQISCSCNANVWVDLFAVFSNRSRFVFVFVGTLNILTYVDNFCIFS